MIERHNLAKDASQGTYKDTPNLAYLRDARDRSANSREEQSRFLPAGTDRPITYHTFTNATPTHDATVSPANRGDHLGLHKATDNSHRMYSWRADR